MTALTEIMTLKKHVMVYWISYCLAEYFKFAERRQFSNFPSLKKLIFPPIFRLLDFAAQGGRATRSFLATFLI